MPPGGVAAVLRLLHDGATVPFVARYRKEATGELDEVQIRDIAERCERLRDLEARRSAILKSLQQQGVLSGELREQVLACSSKRELEDVYLPFRPKRHSKAALAREQGLEPLALRILSQPAEGSVERDAQAFIDAERKVHSAGDALAGAHHIAVERIAEHAVLRRELRQSMLNQGNVSSRVVKKHAAKRSKFEDYYDFSERLCRIPSHRYLAICRGEGEGMLRVKVELPEPRCLSMIARHFPERSRSPYVGALRQAVQEAYRKRLHPALEREVRGQVLEQAERTAIEVFAENLRNLLFAAPLGSKTVIAIDPGIRTGCKCVVLDSSGVPQEHVTLFPQRSDQERKRAEHTLVALVRRHDAAAIAVGNGTAGRETERFARSSLKAAGLSPEVISVNEAGASVYSASELARQELPDLDVTLRGAVSIGRRLQDPLAELVKIDPKAIGVGQYQHDVDQNLLATKLHEVVESCVNQVGVELSTASSALLSYVAGLSERLAGEIVSQRSRQGGFAAKKQLLKVKGLGPKAFEQCAGFVRIAAAENVLDRSAIHPERYGIVQRMAADLRAPLSSLVGTADLAGRIELSRYATQEVGEPTLKDILRELEKPGRDPRQHFEALRFRDDVSDITDLRDGMILNGIVTNVTAFGAFVDVGVHQDGLVHISQLADRFVKVPAEVVQVGQRVTVRVLSVDLERRRISLSRKDLS